MQMRNDLNKKKVRKKTRYDKRLNKQKNRQNETKEKENQRSNTFWQIINWFGSASESFMRVLVLMYWCIFKSALGVDPDYFYHVLYWTFFQLARLVRNNAKWHDSNVYTAWYFMPLQFISVL